MDAITIRFRGTLESPPVTLVAPVVEELPDNAAAGALVTYQGKLMVYVGDGQWMEHPRD